MRKRNHTVTIRMNDKEYTLLRQKMKESGQTQQAVVLAAIENVEIVSSEVMEELKVLVDLKTIVMNDIMKEEGVKNCSLSQIYDTVFIILFVMIIIRL